MIAKRKLSVADVVAMAEAGLFAPDERVELLEGEIYAVTPPSSQHAAWVDRIMKALERAYGDRVIIRVQSPVALSEHSSPEPDVSVLSFQDDFYEAALPRPSQVLLVVEVAWSSLGYDRETKLPLYARADIPECWIVDVDARQLEVYREPRGDHYRTRLLLTLGEAVTPVAVPGAAAITF